MYMISGKAVHCKSKCSTVHYQRDTSNLVVLVQSCYQVDKKGNSLKIPTLIFTGRIEIEFRVAE
jgi:hypothetical protein